MADKDSYDGSPLESLARVFIPGGTIMPMAEVWTDNSKKFEARAFAFMVGIGFEAVKTGIICYYSYNYLTKYISHYFGQ